MHPQSEGVGFFMETSFHYEVYRNIITALLSQNVRCELLINDLIEPTFVNEMIATLNKIRTPGLTFARVSMVLKTEKKYRCLITPYHISYLKNAASLHIRALYGLAKNQWNHARWNAHYHYILCYSRYTQASLNLGEKAVVIGNPRFDDWHNKTTPLDVPEELKLDKNKPTLLYAPTYGELSSLPHWAEKLGRLSHEYNIIAKLHHGTMYRESERGALKLARRHLKKMTADSSASLALLRHADIVITDNSGFIFDAINADKKVILLNWQGMDSLLQDNATFSDPDSPDQQVRSFLPVASDMQDLRHYLSDEYQWQDIAPQLAHIKQEYCDAFNDGMAGLRAALVIIEAMAERR
jgi:Putative glycosyl/glycerophosphate transferases involved in teichoic acid biosynthesis TagF/TagB/EpsJ/RodC